MDSGFQRLFQRLADCIDEMGSDACQGGLLFGLRGVPECCQRKRTKQWERGITKEIAKRCPDCIEPKEPPYPKEAVRMYGMPLGSRGKTRWVADLLIRLGECFPLFVECKSIFESVLRVKSITDGEGRSYCCDYSAHDESILSDAKHAMTCVSIEEAWIDATKLNCLWRLDHPKYHLGLLLLEFDRKGHELSNRRDYQDLEGRLRNDRWLQVGRKSWDDKVRVRAEKGFQEHVVLWVKMAGGSSNRP